MPSKLSAEPRSWRGVQRPDPGTLLVSEIFGPTVQGEGPSAGRAAMFVRLGGCNLACKWCDTGYTWDASSFDLQAELRSIATTEVVQRVSSAGVSLVVLTGGEPALQAEEAAVLARALTKRGHTVELETSGTVPLGVLAGALDLIVVSPKLGNSGLHPHQRLRWPVLRRLASEPKAVFKFVVEGPHELDEVGVIESALNLAPQRVWIMPEGRDRDTLLRRLSELAGPVADRGWSLSSRLHIMEWGDVRGR